MESLRELYKIGRGPSSSHTMGPARAAHEFAASYPQATSFRVTLYGSLALTGKGHLTDVAVTEALPRPVEVLFDPEKKELPHPNTLDFEAKEGDLVIGRQRYLSIGGGTILKEGEKRQAAETIYPFRNFDEILTYCREHNCAPEQVVYDFEDGGIYDFLREVYASMTATVKRGLAASGKLPGSLGVERKAKTLFETIPEEEEPAAREKRLVCAFAFATSEENASGGTIVTAPTCGASGVLPAVLHYLGGKYGFSERRIVAALATAGLVGVTVKQNASVSGAEAGCQAEVGTATSMAAAAVCRLFNASLVETEYAAEIALEHQLGLTCDPVGGYVQIPCIERNAVAAMRALESAELARVLSGTRKISFDTVVRTMYETGKDLSARYRETSEGGLALSYKGCT